MEGTLNLASIKSIVRRRYRAFLMVCLPIALGAVLLALFLPPTYRSAAGVLIEEQQIPKEYVRTTVTSYVEERLQQISQQVMSRASLVEIINKFNLYADRMKKDPLDEIVEDMRSAISLKTVSANTSGAGGGKSATSTVAFTVSYEGRDPSLVQKVTNTLASLYLNENLRTREQRASGTTEFLQQELDTLRVQSEELEGRISTFKKAHIGELPENEVANQQALGQANRDLDQIQSQIQSAQERKVYLEGQLATIDPNLATVGGAAPSSPSQRLLDARLRLSLLKGTVSEDHPDVKKLKKEIRELEALAGPVDTSTEDAARLRAAQEELAAKRKELGPRHPDVLALEKTVTALSKDVAAAPRANAPRGVSAQNPAYINVATQIASADLQIKGLLDERRKAMERIREYERKVAKAPIATEEYVRLRRDAEMARRKYDDVMSKLMEAKVSQGMEETQRGERFTIVDPAPYPQMPYKPNRLAIALVGLVLSIGAGIGVAAAQESLDPAFKSADEIIAVTGLPVLCSISLIEEEQTRSSARVWIFTAIFGATVAVCLLAVHLFVSPLDVFWFRLLNRVFR